jgi:TPR repeat protein
MRRIAATLAVVALLFSAGSAWADLDDGVAAYERGDYATALQEWRLLAEQGDAKAQHNLGVMYENGSGVPQNYVEAVKWLRMAAEQGDADAQVNLGTVYGTGRGVPINDVRAYMWYSLTKAQGHEAAADNLEIAKSLMTPAQIAKAQALASEM